MDSISMLVARLYEAYNAHRPADVSALYALRCRHRDIASGADHRTPDEIAAGLTGLFGAFPDLRWTLGSILIDDDRAAVSYEMAGHLRGRLGRYATDGQSLLLDGVMTLEVSNGQIVASTDYWDGGALHRQLSIK